jgi:hypothetical protein
MAFNAAADTALTALDTVLAQQANVIGQQVYTNTLHVSPWLDLVPQTPFPEGQSYQLTTLVYERSIPTTDTTGSSPGLAWHDLATLQSGNLFDTVTKEGTQPLDDATEQTAGPFGGDVGSGLTNADLRSYIRFTKQLKPYTLQRATIESPKMSLEDLMFAVHRDQQLNAVTDIMTESTRYSLENRNRDEFDRIAGNLVPCLTAGTPILSTVDAVSGSGTADDDFEGLTLGDSNGTAGTVTLLTSGSGNTDVTPTGNISNAVLDKIYNRNNRMGAGMEAYGRENGRPVYALVLSSEASYALQTESGFRDDIRYSSRVSELIAPLGVEKGFRGFYHLIDDLAPRFTITTGILTRVLPYTSTAGIMSDNAAYDTADYESAFVMHPQVMESQIPNPSTGAKGISFDAASFRGDYRWTNIKHAQTNPDGLIGYFRAIMASATKPIKPKFGYVILFKRGAAVATV